MVIKQALVMVKIAEWWLEPTTANQCGENPDIIVLVTLKYVVCTYMYVCVYLLYVCINYPMLRWTLVGMGM